MMVPDQHGWAMAEDLKSWLSGIGLGNYAAGFAENGVDWDVLLDLTEADLTELGLSLGDRKRLLKAIAGLNLGGAGAPALDESKAPPPSPTAVPIATSPKAMAERRSITVMFIDLVGSTPMSEKLDPEDLREVLRVFHEHCAAVIEVDDGHIARYLGDGILVYFGYPQAHEDDAARAVRAGLGIVAGLGSVNESLEQSFALRLQVRIGIHTGLVVVGDVGTGAARDHGAVVGETPNVAARLQNEAEPDTVVISAATRRLIEGQFSFDDIGARALKGVSSLIRAFRVVAPAETPDRFAARADRGLTPLVGRAAELEMLRQRWEQARDGEMRSVLMIGEAGIGKSRVVHAFREALADQSHQVASWYCSSYHSTSAFFPVIAWLYRALGLDAQGEPAIATRKLEEAARSLEIDDPGAVTVLASMLHLTDDETAGQESALIFRRRLLDVLSEVICAMARRQALVVIVEDAHWADPSTLDLLRELQERLSGSRLLLLITARPEFRPAWNYPQFVQVNLDRLSRRERQTMIEQLTGGKALPDFVLEQIVARTDGVPLFVEELTKTVLEANVWRDAGRYFELQGPFQDVAIPDSLQGSLLSRLDRLAPATREIAQIGATIGREFDRALLSVIAGQPDELLDGSLDELIAAEIIRPVWLPASGGKAFAFRHALIQDAAYQSLLLARRRQFHAAIAEALVRHFTDIVTAQPELAAQHFTSADRVEPALEAWLRAAESAMARGAYAEAKAHVTRGLRLAQRLQDPAVRSRCAVPFLLIRGRIELKETRTKAQQTVYRAATLARQAGMAQEFAHAAMSMCDVDQYSYATNPMSVELVREALDNEQCNDPVLRCRLLARLARSLIMRGDLKQARALSGEARAMAERLGDAIAMGCAIGNELMISDPPTGDAIEARRQLIRHYASLTEEIVDPFEAVYATALGCTRSLEIGDIDEFHEARNRLADLARTTQAPSDLWSNLAFQTLGAMLIGDFPLAEQKANDAYQAVSNTGFAQALGIYGMQMFSIRREQGRLGEVAPLVKRFIDENPEESVWKPGLMLIANELGFHAQARQHFEAFAATGFDLPEDVKRPATLTYFAEVCVVLGDVERAGRLSELLDPYRDIIMLMPPHSVCCGATSHFLGMLSATMKDWLAAEKHFNQALVLNEQIRAWPRLAWTRFEYARMLLARGRNSDTVQARELRALAVSEAERLGLGALLHRNASVEWGDRCRVT